MSEPEKFLGNGILPQKLESAVRTGVLRTLADRNMADRALGSGSTRPGTLVGKANAVWAEVNLTGLASLADVKVQHSLGAVPVLCELVEARNAGGSVFPQAVPILKERWNASTCRVAVNMNGGAQAGTVLKFRVGGE